MRQLLCNTLQWESLLPFLLAAKRRINRTAIILTGEPTRALFLTIVHPELSKKSDRNIFIHLYCI